MSENSKLNFRELLKKTAVTYDAAVERVESEKQRPKVERYRMDKEGTYNVRIMPLAPYLTPEGDIDEKRPIRPSFEYPLRQMFLDIKGKPKKAGGKPHIINIPVIRATQEGVGKSVDLIDTYRKLVNDLYGDDAALIKSINDTRFNHGLRWDNQRVMYVIDLDAKDQPLLLWQASASQYHDFADRQVKLWAKLKKKNEDAEDPLAGFGTSYALEITKEKKNTKTEYSFTIDTTNDYELEDKDLEALFNAPRIPDVIYSYTRYQMEATIAFLKQYDEEHDIDIMNEQEMKDAIDKLKGEIDSSDQSHFDVNSIDNDEEKDGKITIDSLNERYNAILDKGLEDDSDEGTELREDIRAFVEEQGLKIKLKHSMTTEDMLDAIEDALDNAPKGRIAEEDDDEPEPDKEQEPEKEQEPAPKRRRAPRPSVDDDDDDKETDKAEEVKEEKKADDEPSEGRRRRRQR